MQTARSRLVQSIKKIKTPILIRDELYTVLLYIFLILYSLLTEMETRWRSGSALRSQPTEVLGSVLELGKEDSTFHLFSESIN